MRLCWADGGRVAELVFGGLLRRRLVALVHHLTSVAAAGENANVIIVYNIQLHLCARRLNLVLATLHALNSRVKQGPVIGVVDTQ